MGRRKTTETTETTDLVNETGAPAGVVSASFGAETTGNDDETTDEFVNETVVSVVSVVSEQPVSESAESREQSPSDIVDAPAVDISEDGQQARVTWNL